MDVDVADRECTDWLDTLKPLLDRVRADTDSPGGGSVSAACCAFGLSLMAMVVTKTRRRSPEAGDQELEQQLTAATVAALQIADEDETALATLIKSYRSADSSVRRAAELAASEPPRRLIRLSAEALDRVRAVAPGVASDLQGDLALAVDCLLMSARGSLLILGSAADQASILTVQRMQGVMPGVESSEPRP